MATAMVSKSSNKFFFNKTFKLITFRRFLRPCPKSSNASPNEEPSISTKREDDDDDVLDQKKETLRHVFDHFDVDKDGKISCDELMHYMASAGDSVTHNGAKRVIRDFDSDGDGLLGYGDFVRLLEHKDTGESSDDDVLRSAFQMFEVSKGCGSITPKGLQQMLQQLGDLKSHEECAAMIRVFDLDGNGSLDFHEFQQMMMSSPS
ncbi:probable calcium-binding protein CML41 [Neltuma alba]|uniref:probable calcium-binding protein CML41 n=1 Tax=Neltuma alba TaxID=207710 RepID=UPI0010A2EB5C|nr:probable calcium-binding protein CML41 [Prosopis alba]